MHDLVGDMELMANHLQRRGRSSGEGMGGDGERGGIIFHMQTQTGITSLQGTQNLSKMPLPADLQCWCAAQLVRQLWCGGGVHGVHGRVSTHSREAILPGPDGDGHTTHQTLLHLNSRQTKRGLKLAHV